MKYDYIIIGQGIAGSILAYQLLKEGKKILVMDDGHKTSSSTVAAGIYNPIIYRKITKNWWADDLTEYAIPFYLKLEKELNETFHESKNVVRIFPHLHDQNEWGRKSELERFEQYLSEEKISSIDDSPLIQPFGYGVTQKTGRVNVNVFLLAMKQFMIRQDAYHEISIDYAEILVEPEKVKIKNHEARHLIFCEGYQSTKNPWFNNLPFSITKGELLTVKIPELDIDQIVSKGFFILPLGNHLYKIGSTFNWEQVDLKPTAEAKEKLINNLKSVLSVPFEVIDHHVGIRPTIKDRRPLIGTHEKHKNIHIFNGLGAKGILMAPCLAHHFIQYLELGTKLDTEIDIKRFN